MTGTGASPDTPALTCEGLNCVIMAPRGPLHLLRDVSIDLDRSTTLGIVGESGAGKSMLIKAIMGIAPAAAEVTGQVVLDGVDLSSLPERRRRAFLGRKVGMVFQNPMSSLNPFMRVGRQLDEASRYYLGLSRAEGRALAIDLLRTVGIPDPAECYDPYPHQFSGGMKQRIMIATALACEPELLIADEATTALDVTVQKEILDLLQTIQTKRQMSMIIVTHNLGIVAGRTDTVAVMYGGRVVESGPTERLFHSPRHRYTEALLSALPRVDQPAHTTLRTIPGRPPNLLEPLPGCPFAPRCEAREARCSESMPPMTTSADGRHRFACYAPVDPSGSEPTASHPGVAPGTVDA